MQPRYSRAPGLQATHRRDIQLFLGVSSPEPPALGSRCVPELQVPLKMLKPTWAVSGILPFPGQGAWSLHSMHSHTAAHPLCARPWGTRCWGMQPTQGSPSGGGQTTLAQHQECLALRGRLLEGELGFHQPENCVVDEGGKGTEKGIHQCI